MHFKEQLVSAITNSRYKQQFIDQITFPKTSERYAFSLLASLKTTYHFPSNIHLAPLPCHAIIVTISGRASLTFEDKQQELKPNSLAWIPCNQGIKINTSSQSKDWVFLLFFFHGNKLGHYYSDYIDANENAIINPEAKNTLSLCNQIYTASITHSKSQELLLAKLVCDLITSLILDGNHSNKHHRYPDYIIQIINYVEDHYADPLTLDLIASHFATNKYSLSHTFSKFVHQSLMDYIIDYRIKISQELLITTNLSVTEITVLSGFTSANNYILQFKKRVNLTPLAYRQQNQA